MAYAYFKEDGTLLLVSSKESAYPDESVIGFEVADFTDANSVYLDLGSMTVRPRQPFDISIAYNTVTGLPVGTNITLSDGQITVDDGSLEFEADTPETILAYIDHREFIGQYIEIQTGP